MGHNSVVSGYPKSTGILWVDRLSKGPPGIGASHLWWSFMRSKEALYMKLIKGLSSPL